MGQIIEGRHGGRHFSTQVGPQRGRVTNGINPLEKYVRQDQGGPGRWCPELQDMHDNGDLATKVRQRMLKGGGDQRLSLGNRPILCTQIGVTAWLHVGELNRIRTHDITQTKIGQERRKGIKRES